MGTKRKVCVWWREGKHEYVCEPPGWKPKYGIISFADKQDMLSFARASRLMLRERPCRRDYA